MRSKLTMENAPGRLLVVAFLLLALLIPMTLVNAQQAVPTTIPDEAAEETASDIVDFTTQTAQATANTLEDFINRLVQTPKSDLARILLIVGGGLLLFAGWRVYEFIVLIAGFLIGALIAVSVLQTDNTLLTIGALLIGGLIGAALSVFLYSIAVFLIGAYIGVALANGLAFQLSLGPVNPLVLLLGAVIGGLVLLGLSFQFLILVSALVGAQMLALGFGLGPVWVLVLAAIGIIVQLGLVSYTGYNYRTRPRRVYLFRRPAL